MSFDLCNKTDRGTLSELTSKGELDELILGSKVDPFAPKQSPHINHATDHGVRSPFEGSRNVYTATVPEEGDLLYAATIVIRPRRDADGEMLYSLFEGDDGEDEDAACSSDLIESVELRINNQCIQRIERDALDVPFSHTNYPGTAGQLLAFDRIQHKGGSFHIPLNFFFSKVGNAYPLVDSQYPVQVRVNLVGDNSAILVDSNDHRLTGHAGWEEHFDMYLETSQIYLEDPAREKLAKQPRDMVVVQRSDTTYQAPTDQTTFSIKLENNLPIRSIKISGDRVREDTLARFFVNGELRFEHEIGWMNYFGRLQGHGETDAYEMGMPCQKGVCGRMNLSLMDAPRLDLHYIDKEAGAGEGDDEIYVYIENYNVLRWDNGKARLLLHKNRM